MTDVHTSIRHVETTIVDKANPLAVRAATWSTWSGIVMAASFVLALILGSIPGIPNVVPNTVFFLTKVSGGIFLTLIFLILTVGPFLPRERVVSRRVVK